MNGNDDDDDDDDGDEDSWQVTAMDDTRWRRHHGDARESYQGSRTDDYKQDGRRGEEERLQEDVLSVNRRQLTRPVEEADEAPANLEFNEFDEQQQHFEIALATTVFNDGDLDLLFNQIASLHSQLPSRVVQDMTPSLITDYDNSIPVAALFAQPSKTVSLLWKKWFTSELNRASIWMLEVYFWDWKERAGLSEKQMGVFELEKRVVQSVLERVREAEMEEELIQGRGVMGVSPAAGGRRRGGGDDGYVLGWRQRNNDVLWKRVEAAKLAVEASVVSNGNLRLYCDSLGE
ncbi:hypothetical protein EC991_000935 [Linnemannia zychae]|nr:hypothetical protein EC991_000935 [Linnemannia zychae]